LHDIGDEEAQNARLGGIKISQSYRNLAANHVVVVAANDA
jgi:hypothetical protein